MKATHTKESIDKLLSDLDRANNTIAELKQARSRAVEHNYSLTKDIYELELVVSALEKEVSILKNKNALLQLSSLCF